MPDDVSTYIYSSIYLRIFALASLRKFCNLYPAENYFLAGLIP